MRRSRSWGGGGANGGDDDVFVAAARLRKGGKWLGELDVRLQLYAENPLLKRCVAGILAPVQTMLWRTRVWDNHA